MRIEADSDFEAVQWDGTQEAVEKLGELTGQVGFGSLNDDGILIYLPQGELAVEMWDWVIKEGNEFSACDSEFFEFAFQDQ